MKVVYRLVYTSLRQDSRLVAFPLVSYSFLRKQNRHPVHIYLTTSHVRECTPTKVSYTTVNLITITPASNSEFG